MTMQIFEVRWENVNGTIHRTRVTPGTPESAAEYIRQTRGEQVKQILCSAVERLPPYGLPCPACGVLH